MLQAQTWTTEKTMGRRDNAGLGAVVSWLLIDADEIPSDVAALLAAAGQDGPKAEAARAIAAAYERFVADTKAPLAMLEAEVRQAPGGKAALEYVDECRADSARTVH